MTAWRAAGAVTVALATVVIPPDTTAIAATFSNPLDITNPYQPVPPGAVKVFSGSKDGKRSTITDLYRSDTRTFQLDGNRVACRVVEEVEFSGGQLVEDSRNYFAQADDGAVYYFGEVVDEYENGVIVNHEGSWLVGGPTEPDDPPNTATASTPGLFMPGAPNVGDVFKPEDLFPVVDETGTVKQVGLRVRAPAGRFASAIRVLETTRLPGEAPESKWYAAGVGVVRGKTKDEHFALIASTLRQP